MADKRFGCLGLGMGVLLCLSLLLNLVLMVVSVASFAKQEKEPTGYQAFAQRVIAPAAQGSTGKIALLALRGIISSGVNGDIHETMIEDLKAQLQQALEDPKVKAIVLAIDSPGGEVTASDVLYQAVKKAREKKPVVVYMGSVAASGGYYVACAGNYLMANDTTITGSIGVIIQTLNYQQLLGKIGVDAVVFKSGKFKDMLSGSRQMTAEEQQYVQGMVMETYGKFVGIVAAERRLPEKGLRDGIADGRIISGKDALGFKLIDQLGQIEDAFEKARQLAKTPGAAVVKYVAPFRFGRLFQFLGEEGRAKVELQVNAPGLTSSMPQLESGRLYLLPGFYAQ